MPLSRKVGEDETSWKWIIHDWLGLCKEKWVCVGSKFPQLQISTHPIGASPDQKFSTNVYARTSEEDRIDPSE
jgi:hypothetical protein